MTTRAIIASIALFLFASTALAAEQPSPTADMGRMMAELQASHISGHVPPDSSFMKLLQRDARAYLVAHRLPSKSVTIELLRKEPTQSGVSYPKFYLWIRATDTAEHHVEGAMRVAAIERVRFEVTHFTPAAAIRSDPAPLAAIYPALLIPSIRRHAGAE